MSKFLAPIHSWLYNKIKISENLEKSIIQSFDMENAPEHKSWLENLHSQYGGYLSDAPLEDLIDTSNIHGWLQDRILRTEKRTAALLTRLTTENVENLKQLEQVYGNTGKRIAVAAASTIQDPSAGYQAVHDLVLEGMPCDRVLQVVKQQEDVVVWDTLRCLHEEHFQEVGGNVEHYYHLRAIFINQFLQEKAGNLEYRFEKHTPGMNGLYTHTLKTI